MNKRASLPFNDQHSSVKQSKPSSGLKVIPRAQHSLLACLEPVQPALPKRENRLPNPALLRSTNPLYSHTTTTAKTFQALNSYYKNNLFLIEKLNLIKTSKQMDKQKYAMPTERNSNHLKMSVGRREVCF